MGADWLGKVQRRNERRGKPHQGEVSVRIGWRYLVKACHAFPIELWNRRLGRGRWYSSSERMKWEQPRAGAPLDDWKPVSTPFWTAAEPKYPTTSAGLTAVAAAGEEEIGATASTIEPKMRCMSTDDGR